MHRPSRTACLLLGQTLMACGLCLPHTHTDALASAGHIAWLQSDGLSEQAEDLLQAIDTSDEHGLSPARYGQHELREQLAKLTLRADRRVKNLDVNSRSARALTADLDRAFKQLLTDLDRGLVDPATAQYRVYAKPANHDVDQLYGKVQQAALSVDQALETVTPSHRHYSRLRSKLRTLLDRRANGQVAERLPGKRDDAGVPARAGGGSESPTGSDGDGKSRFFYDPDGFLPVGIDSDDASGRRAGPDLRSGASHPVIMTLKRRLIGAGALANDTVLTPRFDTTLLVALKVFQAQNGLPESGKIDIDTLAALDLREDEAIARIVQSLERWRWMPDDLGERYVLVNLPNYRLELFNGPQRIIDMPVVIGKVGRGTPVFSRDMQFIEFSPTWTVPRRIAENELLPLERRKPGYLASRNFRLMRESEGRLYEVPDSKMTPATFSKKPFPYMLRQRPGEGNALGRMKFMLPNPYAIYLHDTPAKHLFGEPTRAYSHGCIRLEDPDRLASLLLQIDGKSLDEIDTMLAGTTNNRVHLKTFVPTHLTYMTTWVDDAGRLQNRPDVYGLDVRLREALMQTDSLLSRLPMDSQT